MFVLKILNKMTLKPYLLALICSILFTDGFAQKIATLEVELARSANGLSIPVQTNLDEITFLPDSVLNLVEIQGSKRTPVSFQVENGEQRTLHWMIDGKNEGVKKYIYELVKGNGNYNNTNLIKANNENGSLTILAGNKNLLRYQFETLYPPQGIDTAFKRNAFIHPLWTPNGQELTRIQPPDHYHHYGIWNPWTHVLYQNDTIDFWNIGDHKGTVRFANFVSVTSGSVFGGYEALHEHVVTKDNKNKVALNELQKVNVYSPWPGKDHYFVDFTFKMNCAGEGPFLILAYRYAGFGWRTTEKWNNKNSVVLTSEGKDRKTADGSKARWCIVQGELDSDYGGAVMMSYPSNYNHPEPLRIWPENQYNRGDMFANFSPTKDTDWLLIPGKSYTLKYRLLVFNGQMNKEKAETAWWYFSSPPKVIVKQIDHK
jgi:hypothetical protein